jgi:3-deoxy-7-phosphoheptulonate synthase
MQNFELLKILGKINKPVILKRGFGNTIEEWLSACEYLLKYGNSQVILCERGIRTFETMTRNTLDISAIPIVKKITNLPIIVDPSHACGRSDLVKSLALASIAAGADGLLLEVHPHPNQSLSDKEQAISINEFDDLLNDLDKVATALGRKIF